MKLLKRKKPLLSKRARAIGAIVVVAIICVVAFQNFGQTDTVYCSGHSAEGDGGVAHNVICNYNSVDLFDLAKTLMPINCYGRSYRDCKKMYSVRLNIDTSSSDSCRDSSAIYVPPFDIWSYEPSGEYLYCSPNQVPRLYISLVDRAHGINCRTVTVCSSGTTINGICSSGVYEDRTICESYPTYNTPVFAVAITSGNISYLPNDPSENPNDNNGAGKRFPPDYPYNWQFRGLNNCKRDCENKENSSTGRAFGTCTKVSGKSKWYCKKR